MCDKSKLLCNFAQIFKEIVMRKRFIHILWAVFGTGILTVILAFVAIWFGMIGYMPDIEDLQNPINRFATQVYSADGKVLGTWNLNKENRIVIPYKKMSPYLIKALVATEDERFYEHSGIDFRALGRAIVKRGILGQTNAGGGSTITQQLAKQLYSEKAGSTMERLLQKPIEWVIAVKLERYYTKEEILALYLNYFDFLHNAVGIKTAANTYFNKEPKYFYVSYSFSYVLLRLTSTDSGSYSAPARIRRDYEKLPDTPYGEYAQADFGEKWMSAGNGRSTKVYFFAIVLARSRYKFTFFSPPPFRHGTRHLCT